MRDDGGEERGTERGSMAGSPHPPGQCPPDENVANNRGIDSDTSHCQYLRMPDYTLAELARLADVTPRTIRYYVAQGLLPSPDSAGPATRYGEAALARLRLIKQFQRDHLPLAEIRVRLDAMTTEDIAALAGEPDTAPTPGSALDYVRGLLRAPTPLSREAPMPPPAGASAHISLARTAAPVPSPSLAESLGVDAEPATPPAPSTTSTSSTSATSTTPDRSTWERLTLHPDIELHVRRPLDRATNKRVERLTRIARELFDDES
jgi:DNA-binding transcriptional MerR regulator